MSDTSPTTENQVELPFPVCYEIGNGLLGGASFNVALVFHLPSGAVTGFGYVTQAVNPPLAVSTHLTGTYVGIMVQGGIQQLIVNLTGYPVGVRLDQHHVGSIWPVIGQNTSLNMLLDDTMQSGTASFWYFDNSGNKQTVTNATVRSVDFPAIPHNPSASQ